MFWVLWFTTCSCALVTISVPVPYSEPEFYTVKLSANNKDKVILRLIAGNGFKSNWNLDYVVVNGEKMEEAKPVEEEAAPEEENVQQPKGKKK